MLILLLQAAQNTQTPVPGPPSSIVIAAGWVALGFLGLIGIAILYYVFTRKIDLAGLISEPSGEASMSRFQLLIFTFVIAACLFLVVATNGQFPSDIPPGVLILLGISSSSYLVSKGIQASSKEGLGGGPDPQVIVKGASTTTKAGGKTIQFQADVVGLTNTAVTWSVDPASGFGTIDPSGLYTPPPATAGAPNPTGKVTIKATSVEDVSLTDVRNISLV